jgi:hypothetical protein
MSWSEEKCGVCGEKGKVESVTVRLYMRRSQEEFRYRLGKECRQLLQTFLAGGAMSRARGIFDPPSPYVSEEPKRNGS